MRINQNLYSLGIYKRYTRTLDDYSKSMSNISSGLQVKNAKDNPNKIAQAESLRISVISRNAAASNIQDTNSMLQTFDGALQEYNNNATRLKQLTVMAATGTCNDGDREIIQKEVDGILKCMEDLGNNTKFNGISLSANAGSPDIISTIGELKDETINIPRVDLSNATLLGNASGQLDVTSQSAAISAMEVVENINKTISDLRSRYGAIQSRLEDSYESITEISDTLTSAQSNIADADVAKEIMSVTKNKILIDSAIGLMAQSNKFPQDALNVLANVR